LLGRIGKIAAAAGAPFIAAISTECLKTKDPDELHPLIRESWSALYEMPHAQYLGLTVPRFLLRWPYGAKTEPIESFRFEEFIPQTGLKGMLWANGSILAGLLLGQTFSMQGLPGMQLGTILSISDVPLYYYTDADGDQIALPSTERLVPESLAAHIAEQNFMPVVSVRGRPEVRLGGFKSLHGDELAGPWSPQTIEFDDRKTGSTAAGDASNENRAAESSETGVSIASPCESVAVTDEICSVVSEITDPLEVDPNVSASAEHLPTETPHTVTSGTIDELDALLDSLVPNEADQSAANANIDPDLADLLADL
jgi:type VI secretion system protein ImpC